MANKDNAKQWFETGDYPTQAQFAQVFEWLRWKDESVAIIDVAGLTDILNGLQLPIVSKDLFVTGIGGIGYYNLPFGYILNSMAIFPNADAANAYAVYDADNSDIIPADATRSIPTTGRLFTLTEMNYGYNVGVAKTIKVVAPQGTIIIIIKTKII